MGEKEFLGEGEIIEIIRSLSSQDSSNLIVPIGDDAAAAAHPAGFLLMTTDMVCEGIHFTLRHYSYHQVGWKATVAAISDIAAMGGECLYCLVAAGFDSPPDEEMVRELYSGITDALDRFGGLLVGGDTTRSPSGLSLAVTIIGSSIGTNIVTRSGARAGDVVGVTGNPGRSAAGLALLQEDNEDLLSRFPELVKAHLFPHARVGEGMVLARSGATAMEDISDGLAVELRHICEESGCGCLLNAERVPLKEEMRSAGDALDIDPLEWALWGGEDFELVFTCKKGEFGRLEEVLQERGTQVTEVGEIVEREMGLRLLQGSEERELGNYGYEHFS